MDSHDSSGPPPHIHHAHLQHHHHPPPPAHHGVLMIPHSQTQHYSSNNSYALPSSNTSVAPTTTPANSNTGMMHQQNPRFPFNSIPATAAENNPTNHQYSDGSHPGSGGAWLGMEPAKKKRGRPRKYSPDNSIGLGLSPSPGGQISSAAGHVDSGGAGEAPSSSKRNRGRPPGSGKRQLDALGVPGLGFTPHVIMVESGEDIVSTIVAFSQQGPRIVCILSATGAVCNVELRQTGMPTNTVTYEGRFDIISLSGSFVSSESNASHGPGGLSVSLAGSDGRVLGGGVGDILKAASPVQIIVGSFITEAKKTKKGAGDSTTSPPSHLLLNFGSGTGPSHSSGESSDSAEDNEDETGNGLYPNVARPIQSMAMYPMDYTMKLHPSN